MRLPRPVIPLLLALGLAATACSTSSATTSPGATGPTGSAAPGWEATATAAHGQTVQIWMYGGEEALNHYIDQTVTPAAAAQGVTVQRVPIEDTADAIKQINAAKQAGTTGPVDLVWVNGKNFTQAKEAGLWATDWTMSLPNAALLDPADATLRTDFGVAVDGQELPWSRAAFVYAADSAKVVDPPRDFEALLAYAQAHPGRVTYPAPPDFTGSAFVRQAVQSLGPDRAFALLKELRPLLYQSGVNQPKDETALEDLFANGQVDLAMSYNPNFVETAVKAGRFPATTRPYTFTSGTLQNVSFLAIPNTSAHQAGAAVVANLLTSPEMQAAKLTQVGIPTVLNTTRLGNQAGPLATIPSSPYTLTSFGPPLDELPADQVTALDKRWIAEVTP